jgi:XapX domain-containing protein
VRIALGFVAAFAIGVGCRWVGLPALSPNVPGACLVLTMALGYGLACRWLDR